MTNPTLLCDGCGQVASAEHVARRLRRLAWMTRYRPVHVGTVLLGAYSPDAESDFLYAESGSITGEAARVLAAVGITPHGKAKEAVLSEFQRGGFLLGYVMECPLEAESRNDSAVTGDAVEGADAGVSGSASDGRFSRSGLLRFRANWIRFSLDSRRRSLAALW